MIKKLATGMTKFQKWIIALLITFGLIFFYFWRQDVEYKKDYERCKDIISRGDERNRNTKYISQYIDVIPEECRKYL